MNLTAMSKKIFIMVNGLMFLAILFLFVGTADNASATEVKFTPQVPIQVKNPGTTYDFTKKEPIDFTNVTDTRPIADYIKTFFKYLSGVAGILATVFMMIGGLLWLTAGGSPDKISSAKAYVTSSITGLLLAFGAYILLATINTDLVNLRVSKINQIAPMGCCPSPKDGGKCAYTSQANCSSGWKNDSDLVCSGDGTRCESGRENARKLLYDNQETFRCVNEGGSPIVLTLGNDTNSAQQSCRQTCKGAFSGFQYVSGVTNYYCCKCTSADPNATRSSICSDGDVLKTEGKSCEVTPGNPGYCRLGFCTPCKKTGEACDSSVLNNYQCCSADCQFKVLGSNTCK